MSSNPWNWQDPYLHAVRDGWENSRFRSATDYRTVAGGFVATGPFSRAIDALIDRIAPSPWLDGALSNAKSSAALTPRRQPLYTTEERRRRDSTVWTTVQGVLAPIQFVVFLISLSLVVNYLLSGHGYAIATASVIVKTLVLYAIMITGSIWEKKVFGRYLFAPAFFWEDAVSMLVLALHTAYIVAVIEGLGTANGLMLLALAAYASYAINATQFILKLRAARLEAPSTFARSSAG